MPSAWPADPGSLSKTVRLAAQSASLGSTGLLVGPPSDMYAVDVYLECTTAGSAGTVLVTVAYTDTNGVANQVTGALVLTSAAPLTAHLAQRVVFWVASGDITFTSTVTGAVGSPIYAVTVRCARLASTN